MHDTAFEDLPWKTNRNTVILSGGLALFFLRCRVWVYIFETIGDCGVKKKKRWSSKAKAIRDLISCREISGDKDGAERLRLKLKYEMELNNEDQ